MRNCWNGKMTAAIARCHFTCWSATDSKSTKIRKEFINKEIFPDFSMLFISEA